MRFFFLKETDSHLQHGASTDTQQGGAFITASGLPPSPVGVQQTNLEERSGWKRTQSMSWVLKSFPHSLDKALRARRNALLEAGLLGTPSLGGSRGPTAAGAGWGAGSRQAEALSFGKAFIQVPPPSQKGGGGFQPQPRCELGCSHPCLLPPVPVLCDRRPVQASRSERLPKTVSLSWSHTPWATYCTGSREARRSTVPPPPPRAPRSLTRQGLGSPGGHSVGSKAWEPGRGTGPGWRPPRGK